MPRATISACLIVQDEQERLPQALRSVSFCDQVVVVDGGSRDETVAIARAAGAEVISNPWPGFAAQRNVALDAASGDWVLEIDADERISEPLRRSIEEMLEADPPPAADMALFALRHHFLGRALGPSAKYPAYRSRLFRRGNYRHDETRMVHEGLDVHERPLVLEGDLEHELADSISEAVADMLAYARLEATQVVRPHSPLAYLNGLLLRPPAKWAYRTFIDAGWRDGWQGLVKISLDVSSDVLVWTRLLGGAGAPRQAAAQAGEHFGRRRSGQAKVVAVASTPASAARAATALSELQGEGVDVALLAHEPPAGASVPFQPLRGLLPLPLLRSLEAEAHVRRADLVIAADRRARFALLTLPPRLRPPLASAQRLARLRRDA